MMARRSVLVMLLCALPEVSAKACEGNNLPKDAKLRIGTKFRPDVCDKKTQPGDKLKMHYTGTLYSDCSKFDTSLDRNEAFAFTLGKGEVIRGWDDGLRGMCIGEKRKLTIASDMAYGDGGSGEKIPGGSTLVFEVISAPNTCLPVLKKTNTGLSRGFQVELLDIKRPAPKSNGKGKKKKKKKKKKEEGLKEEA